MNRSLFCIFINYLNVEVDQWFQVALMSKSLKQIPSLGIITHRVWTLMAFLCSSLILSSAKLHQKNPAQDTNILPGFDNLQNNEKKHTKKATFPFIFFFLSFLMGTQPNYTDRCRCFSTKQKVLSSVWWPLESFSLLSKGNSTIEVLHYWVMNTSKLVNNKLQLFLCWSENKI